MLWFDGKSISNIYIIYFFRVKSARRKPNQPSNPFADSEDEDFIADEEKFDQSFKGESLRNNASNR